MNTQYAIPLGLLASAALAACGSGGDLSTPILDAGPRADAGPQADAGAGPAGLCPPNEDDVGLELGDTIPNLDLLECDGTPVELHEVCSKKASYFFVYADW